MERISACYKFMLQAILKRKLKIKGQKYENKVFILCVALATICSGVQAEAGFFKKRRKRKRSRQIQ